MPTVSGSILVAGCGQNTMSVIHEWSKDRDAFKKKQNMREKSTWRLVLLGFHFHFLISSRG